MKLTTIIKRLQKVAIATGYHFVRKATHGSLYRDDNGNTINFGGTSSDLNFHRKVIRNMRKHGHDVEYIC